MFNLIFYGRYCSWDFFGSAIGAQAINLTEDGIREFILPKIKEKGYTQVISMEDRYGDDFTDQFMAAQKQNKAQVCEIKEEHPDDGYTLTYYVFLKNMEYDAEFDEQNLIFDIFAFQDFDNSDDTDEMPI